MTTPSTQLVSFIDNYAFWHCQNNDREHPNDTERQYQILVESEKIMDLIGALRNFARVAETSSFSVVAREVGSSQSAVTRQVAQLEEHFGVRLFHRTSRKLSLTDDGNSLLTHTRRLLDYFESVEASLGNHSTSPIGLVRVGISIAGGLFIAPRLPMLLTRHPGLAVELVMRDQLGDMVAERLDLALQAGEITDSSLIARRIYTRGRIAVASPAYLEAHGMPVRPAELANHACVVHDNAPDSATWRFAGPEGPQSIQISGAFIATNSEAVHLVVRSGYGIALLPEVQVIDDVRSGQLIRLLPNYPSQELPVSILYPSRRSVPPRTRVVMDFLVHEIDTGTKAIMQTSVSLLGAPLT
jgi:DNA-binding transcriptional LysR family regulator